MNKHHIHEWRQKIQEFSKTHQTNKKDFETEWIKWVNHNRILYETEKQRLIEIGCKGDLDDKLFKSARYYYRKKNTEKQQKSKRKNYEGFTKNIREMMKQHIFTIISYSETNKENISPMTAYDNFCKTQTNRIYKEIQSFLRQTYLPNKKIDPYQFAIQFRKSYKNHFYKIRNNS
jgi:hypothetical protein